MIDPFILSFVDNKQMIHKFDWHKIASFRKTVSPIIRGLRFKSNKNSFEIVNNVFECLVAKKKRKKKKEKT